MGAKYDLGTAEGKIKVTYDGAGVAQAEKGQASLQQSQNKTSASLTSAGSKAGIAGLAIAAGIGLAANSAIGFEKQISGIAAVSGATTKQLDQLRQKALQLGADTQFSADEAAQAMEELAKAGVNTTDILNGAADATVALAAAGGVDLATAATLAANAMNGFGLSAKDLPKVVDDIAGAANASAIDVGELGQSMQQAAAVAHLTGLSYHDTAVAIAEMGNAGIKGSDAGTSLKTFLQNLIPQTKQQIELFRKLGLTTKNGGNAFFDAAGKAKPFADIQQVLQNALKGQSKEQELATLQTLFGSDAIRAAAVFAGQGAAGFNQLSTAISGTKAADVAAARMNNTAGRIEQLKGSVQTLAIAIGELLLPVIDRITKAATVLANSFTGLSPTWQKVIITAVGVVGSLFLIFSAVTKLIQIVRIVQGVWQLLNASFLFSPIGLVIIAIIALVVAFYLLWTRSAAFRNFFIGLWGHIWSFMKTIGAWFAGPFVDFFKKIWADMQAIWAGIWSVIKTVIDFVIGYFRFWWNIVSAIIGFFAPAIKGAFDLVIAIAKLWWSVFSTIWTVAFTVIRAIVEPVINWLVGFWKWAFGIIVDAAKLWWGYISAVFSAVYGFIAPIIKILVDDVVSRFTFLFNFIIALAKGWWATFSQFWNGLYSFISLIVSAIVGYVKGQIDLFGKIFSGIATILGKVKGWFDGLKAAATGGVGSLISYVSQIPKQILDALGNLASLLYDAGRKIIQGLVNGIGSMAGEVKDKIKSVLGAAGNLLPHSPAKEGPFSGKGWTTYSGQAIMLGLAEGLESQSEAAAIAMLRAMDNVRAQTTADGPLLVPTVNLAGGTGGYASGAVGASATTVNNTVNVTAPAPVVDPNALADYAIRKLNNSIATRSTPVAVGAGQ